MPGGSFERKNASNNYIYLSFSANDAKTSAPFAEMLKDAGYLFYYPDDEAGQSEELSDYEKEKIAKCAIVVAFFSYDYFRTPKLPERIDFALKKGKTVISINVGNDDMDEYIRARFGSVQETARYSFSSQSELLVKLDGFGYLASCTKSETEPKPTAEKITFPNQSKHDADISSRESERVELSVNESDDGVITVFRAKKEKNAFLTNELDNKKFKLPGTRIVIGKMLGAVDLRIECDTVSRKHAEIIKEGRNYYITDLNSTNGTFINGQRIQGGVKQELSDGDHIMLSDVPFKFTRE